jgi:hypothetical protein
MSQPVGSGPRKISGGALAADVRAEMTDKELCSKYGVNKPALENLLKKLVNAGLLTENEMAGRENAVPLQCFNCPACGKPQTRKTNECPDCGVIFEKLKHDRLRQEQHERAESRVVTGWECLACGAVQATKFEKCPVCGISAAKRETVIENDKDAAGDNGQIPDQGDINPKGAVALLNHYKVAIAITCSVIFLVVSGMILYSVKAQNIRKRQIAMENELRVERENRLKEESERAQRQEQLRQEEWRLQQATQKVETGMAAQLKKSEQDSSRFWQSHSQQVRKQTQAEAGQQRIEREKTEHKKQAATAHFDCYYDIMRHVRTIGNEFHTGALSRISVRQRAAQFLDKLAELKAHRTANPEVVGRLDRASVYLTEAGQSDDNTKAMGLIAKFYEEITPALKLMAAEMNSQGTR